MKNLTLIIFFIASCLSALAYATDSASQIFSKVKSKSQKISLHLKKPITNFLIQAQPSPSPQTAALSTSAPTSWTPKTVSKTKTTSPPKNS